jgi:hypothetical protein
MSVVSTPGGPQKTLHSVIFAVTLKISNVILGHEKPLSNEDFDAINTELKGSCRKK